LQKEYFAHKTGHFIGVFLGETPIVGLLKAVIYLLKSIENYVNLAIEICII